MNRTTPLASICGIILSNGKDCPNQVNPDAPLNLCAEHFQAAFEWHLRTASEHESSDDDLQLCSVCGEVEMAPGARGRQCRFCGFCTTDFVEGLAAPHVRPEEIATILSIREPRLDVVYYIEFGDRIKIGTSGNLRSRLQALPHDRVLAIERGGQHLEHRRHVQFAHLRVTGEWFTKGEALLAHIATLRTDVRWSSQLRDWEQAS